MFELLTIKLDYKDLKMLENALLNEIGFLENENFTKEIENIDEYKELLKELKKHINEFEKKNF
ncbi:MAG: hypothetical protein ACNI3H_00685 [Halarcobacter ebronensis]|uniref:hypothetical protein n=1 Tax=Halarcobacter ebronensis TaxID=1462615 RepID=UPI003C70BC84